MGHAGIEDLEPGRHARRARRRRARAAGTQLHTTPSSPTNDSHNVALSDARVVPKDIESGGHDHSDNARDRPQPTHDDNMRPYLWVSALGDYENDDFRFNDFQPCYIACIRDLEYQIKKKIQSVHVPDATRDLQEGVTREMEGLLVRYSQLVEALETIEYKDRVFEEDGLRNKDDLITRMSGERRRIPQPLDDHDRAHEAMQNNLILSVLDYVANWNAANSVKHRYGNVTKLVDRLIVGVLGGAMLLVPMIIMVFATSRTARLVIVSLATMLFALGVSFMNDVRRDGVIASTAAYAAVMVVFIGSSDTVGGDSNGGNSTGGN